MTNSANPEKRKSRIKARRFYKKMGFEPFGEEFLEAGIMHINMKLKQPSK